MPGAEEEERGEQRLPAPPQVERPLHAEPVLACGAAFSRRRPGAVAVALKVPEPGQQPQAGLRGLRPGGIEGGQHGGGGGGIHQRLESALEEVPQVVAGEPPVQLPGGVVVAGLPVPAQGREEVETDLVSGQFQLG